MELPPTPYTFDQAFLDDLPYGPDVLFLDRIEEISRETNTVICRMPTDRPMPITDSQRVHPVRHPKHVAGAVMVHATGMLGFVHAYYILGLRHRDGWIGYGTHIHRVVFRKLVTPGAPIIAKCTVVKQRLGKERHMIRYVFDFRHEGQRCYEGEQTAVWMIAKEGMTAAEVGASDG